MAAPVPAASAAPAPRSALLVVFLTVFIDLLGFGIVLPVMPRQAEPLLRALGMSEVTGGVVIGLLFSVFSLMQFLFSPLWGRLSDHYGRRPLLLLSLAGSVVFYALYGWAATAATDPPPSAERAAWALGLMLLSRIGAGIAGASVGTAAAVIADCTTPENRARGMALIGIAFGGGFTLGPLIAYFGLALFDRQPWGVGAIASLLSLVAFLLALVVFRETRPPGPGAAPRLPRFARTAAVLALPTVGNFLVFAFIGFMLLLAGGGYRPLAKRLPETSLLAGGVALLIVGLAVMGGVAWATRGGPAAGTRPLLGVFYAAAALAVAGFACVNPSVSALISKRTDPDRQGEVLGVNQSFASLGRIIGPFMGSVLFAAHPSHTLPFVAAVLVLCGVAVLLPRIAR
jgi:MFS family permease